MLNAGEVMELARTAAVSDEEIVARVRAGDAALFEVLMRRHNQRVYRAVRAILRGDPEVEDVMQQAYVSAFSHLDQFQGEARFSTWLVRIAVNEALGRRRRAGRLVSVEDDEEMDDIARRNSGFDGGGGPGPSPEDRVAGRELAAAVEAAVDALPESYRTVFVLREIEGLDTAEVAGVLGVNEPVVKTRLYRAREQVRRQLDARLGEATVQAFQFGAARCDRVVLAVMHRLTLIIGGPPR